MRRALFLASLALVSIASAFVTVGQGVASGGGLRSYAVPGAKPTGSIKTSDVEISGHVAVNVTVFWQSLLYVDYLFYYNRTGYYVEYQAPLAQRATYLPLFDAAARMITFLSPTPARLYASLSNFLMVLPGSLPARYSVPVGVNPGTHPVGFAGDSLETLISPNALAKYKIGDSVTLDVADTPNAIADYLKKYSFVTQSDGVTALLAAAPLTIPSGVFEAFAATEIGDVLVHTEAIGTSAAVTNAAAIAILRVGTGYLRDFDQASNLTSPPPTMLPRA
jgi:hypothetical protein